MQLSRLSRLSLGRHLHESGAVQGGTGIEKDLVSGIGQGLIQVGGEALDCGSLGKGTQFIFISTGEDRVHSNHFIRGNLYPPLIADGADRANQMLIGSHASSDAIHNNSKFVFFYHSSGVV